MAVFLRVRLDKGGNRCPPASGNGLWRLRVVVDHIARKVGEGDVVMSAQSRARNEDTICTSYHNATTSDLCSYSGTWNRAPILGEDAEAPSRLVSMLGYPQQRRPLQEIWSLSGSDGKNMEA